MEPQANTQIDLETYQKVVEAELTSLRRDNLNLKIVNYQLQEDLKAMEEELKTTQRQLQETNSGKEKPSAPLRMVREATHINEHQ